LDKDGHPLVARGPYPCGTDTECVQMYGGDGIPTP
jgi:hypothetical protein